MLNNNLFFNFPFQNIHYLRVYYFMIDYLSQKKFAIKIINKTINISNKQNDENIFNEKRNLKTHNEKLINN